MVEMLMVEMSYLFLELIAAIKIYLTISWGRARSHTEGVDSWLCGWKGGRLCFHFRPQLFS